MLHLIPAPVHRAGLRIAHALRKRWWRRMRPRIRGCRILALDDADRILLIRQSYGSGQWMPPGGGVRRGEDPLATAVRELMEETGCSLTGGAEVARLSEALHGARNVVHVIAGRTADTPQADGREVIAAAFFALDALPVEMPAQLRAELPGWVETFGRL